MVNYYLDTSALFKQYVNEPGSTWLRARVSSAVSLVSSQLLIVEAVSALNRRAREGSLASAEYQRVRDVFREDCRVTYQIVPPHHGYRGFGMRVIGTSSPPWLRCYALGNGIGRSTIVTEAELAYARFHLRRRQLECCSFRRPGGG